MKYTAVHSRCMIVLVRCFVEYIVYTMYVHAHAFYMIAPFCSIVPKRLRRSSSEVYVDRGIYMYIHVHVHFTITCTVIIHVHVL